MVLNTVPNSPIFQSTLPVRGATGDVVNLFRVLRISIHAPRAGSDVCRHVDIFRSAGISIHAPRAGSDTSCGRYGDQGSDFNPRSPCGERLTFSPPPAIL